MESAGKEEYEAVANFEIQMVSPEDEEKANRANELK